MSIARITVGVATALVALLVTGGCANYYKVTDPTTGRVYYTEELDKRSGGAVALRDGRTGQEVTVQNSEVQEISKEQFETGRVSSGRVAPDSAAARVTQPQPQQPVVRAEPAPAVQPAPDRQATPAGASVGGAAAASVATSPAQLRADLVSGKEQIDRTLNALEEVSDPNQTDLRGAYKTYCDELDRLSAHAQRLEAEADAMRQARAAYFARWDERLAEIDNPTIRAAAEQRRARLRAAQDRISTDAGLARDAYRPLMNDLRDIRKFLDGDLSKDTTAVIGPSTAKAQRDANVVKERIDVVIADLDAVQGATAAPAGTAR